jgi:hypothetical protein
VTREERIRQIIDERTLGFVDMDEATIRTLIYGSFEDIGRPEPFTDGNRNNRPDPGEYTDVNGNGQWDDDMGRAGLGGPNDIVLYEVEYVTVGMTGLMRPILGPDHPPRGRRRAQRAVLMLARATSGSARRDCSAAHGPAARFGRPGRGARAVRP